MSGFSPERMCDRCDQMIAGGIYRLPGDKFSALCRNCHKNPTTCEPDMISVVPPVVPPSVAPPVVPPVVPPLLHRKRGICLWPECGYKINSGLLCSRDSTRFHNVMGRYSKVDSTTITEIEDAAKLWNDYQIEASKARAERSESLKPDLRNCAWPGCDRQIRIGICCHRDSSRFKAITGHRPSVAKPADVLRVAAIWEDRHQPDQKPKELKATVSLTNLEPPASGNTIDLVLGLPATATDSDRLIAIRGLLDQVAAQDNVIRSMPRRSWTRADVMRAYQLLSRADAIRDRLAMASHSISYDGIEIELSPALRDALRVHADALEADALRGAP